MSEEESETSINTPLDENSYFKLLKMKKKGKFSSWKVFFQWLTNNKTLADTFLDEISKLLSAEKQEDPPK